MTFHTPGGEDPKHSSGGLHLKETKDKLLKQVLPVALGAAVIIGAGVWLGVSFRSSGVPEPAAQTDAADPEPAADSQPTEAPAAHPVEAAAPKDPKPEPTPIASVENPEEPGDEPAEEEPEDAPAEEEPAPAPRPSIAFSQEKLDQQLESIIGSIITEGMTKREQAYAIFRYVNSHVLYVGTSIKDSWQEGAFEAINTGRGDCYTYYALSRALLDAVGIDNLEVQRVGGTASHYWNLVNCGDGWYHFDAGPHVIPMPEGYSFFLFDDEAAAAYTAVAGRNYYDFDGSLYPPRGPAEPVQEPEALPEPEPDLPEPDETPEDPEPSPEDSSLPPEEDVPPEDPFLPPEDPFLPPEETLPPEELLFPEEPLEETDLPDVPSSDMPSDESEPPFVDELPDEADDPDEDFGDVPPVIIQAPPVNV